MPIPVIGRIEAGRVILDLRCLEDETAFIAQLDPLVLKKGQCVLRDGRVAASSG
jgi:L-seryl-tRNA(Ser) seleniumtransferase